MTVLGARFLGLDFFGVGFSGAAFLGVALLGVALLGLAVGTAFLGDAFFGAAFLGLVFSGLSVQPSLLGEADLLFNVVALRALVCFAVISGVSTFLGRPRGLGDAIASTFGVADFFATGNLTRAGDGAVALVVFFFVGMVFLATFLTAATASASIFFVDDVALRGDRRNGTAGPLLALPFLGVSPLDFAIMMEVDRT